MESRLSQLVALLNDQRARLDERDDAAMDLAVYDEREALDALVRVASNPLEDEIILSSCGESIAEIFKRLGVVDRGVVSSVTPVARKEICAQIDCEELHG